MRTRAAGTNISAAPASRLLGSEQRRLMLGDERVDDFAQRLALQ